MTRGTRVVPVPKKMAPRERFLHWLAGDLLLFQDEVAQGQPAVEAFLANPEGDVIPGGVGQAMTKLGLALAFWGRVAEGREMLARSLKLRERTHDTVVSRSEASGEGRYNPGWAPADLQLAQLAALLGREADAQRFFQEARRHLDALADLDLENDWSSQCYFGETASTQVRLGHVLVRTRHLRGVRTYILPAGAEEMLAKEGFRGKFRRNTYGGTYQAFQAAGFAPAVADTDVFGVLRTAETILRVYKSCDAKLYYMPENLALVEVLLPLAGYLADPSRADLREQVRPALRRYYDHAEGSEFWEFYLTVLDLQRAFPEVIGQPVVPDPLLLGERYVAPEMPELTLEAVIQSRRGSWEERRAAMAQRVTRAVRRMAEYGADLPPSHRRGKEEAREGLFKRLMRGLLRSGGGGTRGKEG